MLISTELVKAPDNDITSYNRVETYLLNPKDPESTLRIHIPVKITRFRIVDIEKDVVAEEKEPEKITPKVVVSNLKKRPSRKFALTSDPRNKNSRENLSHLQKFQTEFIEALINKLLRDQSLSKPPDGESLKLLRGLLHTKSFKSERSKGYVQTFPDLFNDVYPNWKIESNYFQVAKKQVELVNSINENCPFKKDYDDNTETDVDVLRPQLIKELDEIAQQFKDQLRIADEFFKSTKEVFLHTFMQFLADIGLHAFGFKAAISACKLAKDGNDFWKVYTDLKKFEEHKELEGLGNNLYATLYKSVAIMIDEKNKEKSTKIAYDLIDIILSFIPLGTVFTFGVNIHKMKVSLKLLYADWKDFNYISKTIESTGKFDVTLDVIAKYPPFAFAILQDQSLLSLYNQNKDDNLKILTEPDCYGSPNGFVELLDLIPDISEEQKNEFKEKIGFLLYNKLVKQSKQHYKNRFYEINLHTEEDTGIVDKVYSKFRGDATFKISSETKKQLEKIKKGELKSEFLNGLIESRGGSWNSDDLVVKKKNKGILTYFFGACFPLKK